MMHRNEAFLRNIYSRGPFQGHALVCSPKRISIPEHPDYDFTLSDKPVSNWVPWVAENYRRQVALTEAVGDDAVPCAWLSTGTHLYAAAFGCTVHRFPDNNPCALPLVACAADADALEVPDIWKTPVLYRIFELARAVQQELGKDVFIGVPDMQSGFDTAALVWDKSDFLCAIIDDEQKQAVKRLVDKCARLFKEFLVAFRREFPRSSPCHCPVVWAPPEMGPWLSNDECGALSTAVFDEFCLPELVDLATTFGGLGMHCCASAEHQFGRFKQIPGFYAFNRVAARQGYAPLLDHFAGPSAPVHVLAWLPDDDMEMLVRRAPPGTRFIFNKTGVSAEEARLWLAKMRALSPRMV
jgi:hypothetical protein